MAASFARRFGTVLPTCFIRLCRSFGKTNDNITFSRLITGLRLTSKPNGFVGPGVGSGMILGFLGLSLGKKDEEDKEVDLLTRTYRSARLAHQRQELQKADGLYHECLKVADEQLKNEEITKDRHLTARTLAFDGLADIALNTGQIEMAHKLFVETMKGCINQGMEVTDNVVVEISLKLSSIFAMQGKKVEAEEGYKFCVETQTRKLVETEAKWRELDKATGKQLDHSADEMEAKDQDTAVLLGMALGSYGRYLLHEKRYEEALPLFERSLLMAKHTLGTSSNQYVVVLNDLATLLIVSSNYDRAEGILNDGITISEKAKLSEVALLYCNLGAIHLRRGQPTEAFETCKTGLSRAKQYNNVMAFKMAEACMEKSVNVQGKTRS